MIRADTRRAAQAAATRSEILGAARRLFAARGYARATVREIATQAGVSPQTVYDSVGSKRAIAAALNDFIDAEAGVGDLIGHTMRSRDPELLATLSTRVACSVVRHCGDIVAILLSGAQVEPELAAVLEEGNRRHVAGNLAIAAALDDAGLLRPGLDVATAGEALAAINEEQYVLVLRDTHGWSMDRIEEWLSTLTRHQVLCG